MDYRDVADGGGGLSDTERAAIVQVAQACASLSFLGSAVIVVANFRFKQLRTYSFQLVVWLAVCDMFANLSYFLGSHIDGSVLCYTQAIVQQFFQVAVIQWTLLISHSLLVMTSSTRAFEGDKRMPWNHLWAWGISSALTIGPVCTGSFGKSDSAFCWIKSGDSWTEGSLWRTIFLVVVFLSMVAIVCMYVTVVKNLGRTQRGILLLSSHATNDRHRDSSTTSRGHKRRKSSKTSVVSSLSFDTMFNSASSRPDAPLPLLLGPLQHSIQSEASPSQERAITSEDNGGKDSQRRAPQATRFWERWTKSDDSCTGDGQRSVGVEGQRTKDSQSSVISFTRSNSQISAKDWLWSTSREAGFFGDMDISDIEGVERENDLWLSSSATAARNAVATAALDSGRASKPLPTLPESRMSTNATAQVTKDAEGLARAHCRRPSRTSIWDKQTPLALNPDAFKTRAASPCTPGGASPFGRGGDRRYAVGSAALDGYSGRPISGNLSVTATPAAAATAVDAGGSSSINGDGGAVDTDSSGERYLTLTRKSSFTHRVGQARGFVRRMSSMDVSDDHSEQGVGHGGVDAAGGEVGRKDGAGPTGPMKRDTTVNVMGPRTGSRGMQLKQPRGSGRPGNMDRFISRVKWYPVIYVFCWIFTLISGGYTLAVGAHNASFSLVMLATVTSRLQGLLNFLWYGLNDSLKQAWLQDFLYRKAVASCCRALWCCCSGPCCSKYDFDDELDASTDKVSHVAHNQDEAGSLSTNSIDLVERMEQGTGVGIGTVITSPPPLEATPARSARKWVVPCLVPSVPRRPQGLAPRRPARPTRKAAHRHSQAKTPRAQRVQTSMAASSSGHQARATWQKRSLLSRSTLAFHRAGTTSPIFRFEDRKRPYGKGLPTGKGAVSSLSSALPIAVSVPMTNPSVQLGSSPSGSSPYGSSQYSSTSSSDYFLDGTTSNSFRLSGWYLRDRAANADYGDRGGEGGQERDGNRGINTGDSGSGRGSGSRRGTFSGSIRSTSLADGGSSVPVGDRAGRGRTGSTRPERLADTTQVARRASAFIARSREEVDPFSERFVGSRAGGGERKEPL